jgi:hypothetical protein
VLLIVCAAGVVTLANFTGEVFRFWATVRGNPVCALTGLMCPFSSDRDHWISGASLLTTANHLEELSTQLDLNRREKATQFLPDRLRNAASWINDNVNQYVQMPKRESMNANVATRVASTVTGAISTVVQSATGKGKEDEDTDWNSFVGECREWADSLHSAARDAFRLQLAIRTFAENVLHEFPNIAREWKDKPGHVRMRVGIIRKDLGEVMRMTKAMDARILDETAKANRLVAVAAGNVELNEADLVKRAQTWSWPTTLFVHGVALYAGALPLTLAIGVHAASSARNSEMKSELERQKVTYASAQVHLTGVRNVLAHMEHQLIVFDDDLRNCERVIDDIYGGMDRVTPITMIVSGVQRMLMPEPDDETKSLVDAAVQRAIVAFTSVRDHAKASIELYTTVKIPATEHQHDTAEAGEGNLPALPWPQKNVLNQ